MRKQLFINLLILFQVFFICCFLNSGSTKAQEGEKIVITSEMVDIDNKKKEAFYSGGVRVVKGEMTLSCNTLKVVFYEEGEGIKQIMAKGHVKFWWLDRYAEAEEGNYDDLTNTVVLFGDPKTWQGENLIKGEKIIYNMLEEKIVVEGGVETILNLNKKTN